MYSLLEPQNKSFTRENRDNTTVQHAGNSDYINWVDT